MEVGSHRPVSLGWLEQAWVLAGAQSQFGFLASALGLTATPGTLHVNSLQ